MFCSGSNEQPLLLVDYFTKTEPLKCVSGDNTFQYEHIRYADPGTKTTCLIEISDFIEKCVFFQAPNGVPYFYRFPTLRHST
jgi:hypothetical protein